MKTLNQWFDEYAISHQNQTNKSIHYFCVPAIYFSIVGLFLSIPTKLLISLFQLNLPIIENWAFVILLLLQFFYFRLSVSMGFKMTIFSAICLIINYNLIQIVNGLYFSMIVFSIAWIGQFYGHKIEGKKPSFIKDLQFLLIGPAWVIENLFSKK